MLLRDFATESIIFLRFYLFDWQADILWADQANI